MTDRLALTKERAKAATPGPYYRSGVRQKWGKIEVLVVCCDDPKIGAVAGVPYSDRTPALHIASQNDADHFANLDPAFVTTLCERAEAADRLEAALTLIQEEAAKDNAPYGRSDSMALANIRLALAELEPK